MSDIAIRVENISKLYQIGEVGTGTLSRDLNRWWAKFRGQEDPYAKIGQVNDRTQRVQSGFVWALKDINFEVKQGEVLGIIGRNGAGKSTLLKILSKITSPTMGKIYTQGRIASLLEVGTGFHPEMTGRENIYLNGAILGMRKWEIDKKFDEIVDFAGVEGYIDTPVKRYSSGMYVRLAFAVAAFLEPEILVVDEVLAVGDAEFQKKCLGRMKDVSANDGRTVLFVSHNLAAVTNLCSQAVFLQNGVVKSIGNTLKIISDYVGSDNNTRAAVSENEIKYSKRCPYAYINSIKVLVRGKPSDSFEISEEIKIEMKYTVVVDNVILHPSFHLLDNLGTCILASFNGDSASLTKDDFFNSSLRKGTYISTMTIPSNFLNESSYRISAFLVPMDFQNLAIVNEAVEFSVIDTGAMRKEYTGQWIGLIRPKMAWSTLKLT